MPRVFSHKHTLTFVGNVGINSVGIESVYQKRQSSKTKCFASISREGLTCELLAQQAPYCICYPWLLPMLPSSTKTSLDTLKGCGKCLSYQPLNDMENGKVGDEEIPKTNV